MSGQNRGEDPDGCVMCGGKLRGRKSHTKTCSAKCRKRLSRHMAKFNEIPSKPRARGRGRYEFTVSVSKARKARKGGKR